MAVAARDAMARDRIEAIADKGYYKSEEILACEEAEIAVVVPKPQTSNAGARGQFDKADFAYDAEDDAYICPAGEQLIYRITGQQDGKAIRTYWSSHCGGCVIKDKCTNSKERRIRPLSSLQAATAGQRDGNTKMCWNGSSSAWTKTPLSWLSAA